MQSVPREWLDFLRQQFPKDSRIQLTEIGGNPRPISPGSTGKLDYIDDAGQFHVKWDNGCTLALVLGEDRVPFPVSWTVKMKKKQKETQDILSYHTQAAGCSDKARAKASGGRQPIEECGRTGL